ncbi:MAG: ABC transporter permease [Oscillospiraceae bacterium]|jgi:simple sugar transport system permease protein|nr:ABC transporter permease [Oscillospiraceae bacterium]
MNKTRQLSFRLVRGTVAILIALLVAMVLVFISVEGDSIADKFSATAGALRNLLIAPLFDEGAGFNLKRLTDILAAMIPTIFTGLSVCVMFSANEFNLGGEGSAMLGAFSAAMGAIYIPFAGLASFSVGLATGLHILLCLLIAAVSCALMMLIPAVLKAKLQVSEMVCSLMLNYVVMYVIKYLMNTHLADKSKGLIQSFAFQPTAQIPQLVDNGSKLSWGFVIALGFVGITALFMYRSRWGYAIRMLGFNKDFVKYAGIRSGSMIVLSQLVGGLLAGLGGGIIMLGRYTTFSWGALPGYGWTGITIAILAGNNPIFVPFAAFFMAYLNKGCDLMATYAGVPSQLIDILQALIFLFFAAEQFLSRYRQKLVVRSAQKGLSAGGGKEARADA